MTTTLLSLGALKAQRKFPKFYFEDGDGPIMAAGSEFEYDGLPPSNGLFVGALDFFGKKRKEYLWEGFPLTTFFSPSELQECGASPIGQVPQWKKCHHTPEFPYYEGLVEKGRIEGGKIVLARRTTLTFDEEVDPFTYLSRFTGGIRFLFSPAPGVAFLGATPEPLFKRVGKTIETAAIAGTRPRGKSPADDMALRNDLLSNEKELREFRYVSHFIKEQLEGLCTEVKAAEVGIVTTPTVQHVCQRFTGTLKEVDDAAILSALHPTPATNGHPREKALQRIYDLEPFDRGYYASPIGYISPEKSSFAVALRSALVIGNEVHLFAGTGIVDGSLPEKEWDELNHKIKHYVG